MGVFNIKDMKRAETKAPLSKVFNGKKYKRASGYTSKGYAQNAAKINFRSEGDLARVVKIDGFYFVYVHQ